MKSPLSIASYTIAAGMFGVLLLSSDAVNAELPSRPAIEGFSLAPYTPLTPEQTTASLELLSGQVNLYDPARGVKNVAQSGMALRNGIMVQTAPDRASRARIAFANGDVIHLGSHCLIALEKHEHETIVNLWQGAVVAYAMPNIEGREYPLIFHTVQGALELFIGKAGFSPEGEKIHVSLFDGNGRWVGKRGATSLTAGHNADIGPGYVNLSTIPEGMETRISDQTNPEVPAVEQALVAFRSKDHAAASRMLTQVQSAFPYNGVAAYYLGLMHVERGDLPSAIKQWQDYMKIDPKGAKGKMVPQHLTLLINQRIQEDIQQAIANEKTLSKAPPEPRSIAVHPLINRGGEKYGAIGKGITAMVISDLSHVPGLKVLERQKIQKLLDEIRLSEGGIVDQETAVRSGRLLRAEKLMIGDYKVEAPEGNTDEK